MVYDIWLSVLLAVLKIFFFATTIIFIYVYVFYLKNIIQFDNILFFFKDIKYKITKSYWLVNLRVRLV